jgi:membrane-associated phospholipid phosphatase
MKYAITSCLLFLGFAILALLIITNNDSVMKWDLSGFNNINGSHIKTLNKILVTFTQYGREVVWSGIIVLLLIFGKSQGRKVAVLLIISFLILVPTGYFLKDEIDRPRPTPLLPDNLLYKAPEGEPAFPSGHSLIVSAGALIMLLRYNQGKQKILSLLLTAEAITVMYSMIYVGAHYPLDVVGGLLWGTAVSTAVIASSKYMTPIFSRIDSVGRKST